LLLLLLLPVHLRPPPLACFFFLLYPIWCIVAGGDVILFRSDRNSSSQKNVGPYSHGSSSCIRAWSIDGEESWLNRTMFDFLSQLAISDDEVLSSS
jgi:hypothetical protein